MPKADPARPNDIVLEKLKTRQHCSTGACRKVLLDAHLPRLKQQFTRRASLVGKPVLPGEDAFSAQPRLANNASKRLVLIRRALVSEKHCAGLNLLVISTVHHRESSQRSP